MAAARFVGLILLISPVTLLAVVMPGAREWWLGQIERTIAKLV